MSQSVRRIAPVASQTEERLTLAPNGEHMAPDTPDSRGHSYDADKARIVARLKRIEGQVRGISRMVEEDKYCIDILTQVSSVTSALQGVAVGLLDEHMRHCVIEAAAKGDDSKVSEATAAIERLLRS